MALLRRQVQRSLAIHTLCLLIGASIQQEAYHLEMPTLCGKVQGPHGDDVDPWP